MKKSIKYLLPKITLGAILFLTSCSESSKPVSDCDTTYEPDKIYYEQNDYTLGYDKGKLNRHGGSPICDPYKDNKVESMPGYVNDGEHIRRVHSDCFCKGFEDGYKSI